MVFFFFFFDPMNYYFFSFFNVQNSSICCFWKLSLVYGTETKTLELPYVLKNDTPTNVAVTNAGS